MTAPAEPGGEWVRLHPLTPLLRGGRFALVMLALAGQQGLRSSPWTVLAVLAVLVPVAVFFGWLSWRAMRYRVTPTELQVDSGVLVKRSRRVPLARVQAVDVVKPFYARLLGLAELRLEVVGGGGGDAEAPLSFLAEDRADVLRVQLLDLSAGRTAAVEGAPVAPEPPENVLVIVPTPALVWSTLLGAPVITLSVLLIAALVATLVGDVALSAVLFAAGPALLGVGSMAVRQLLSDYGFTVAESPDGLRLRHGLLDTRSQTIPAGRVQAVRIREPLLWRRAGWVRVDVDVAGYSGSGEQQLATSALLPVAPRELAEDLVARVLGAGLPTADRPVPPAARWRAPLSARRLKVGVDDRHVVSTSGILTTTTDVAPLAKVQSLRRSSGPWQRRLGLASVHVDTAGRRLPGPVLLHRDQADAAALLADLTERARAARSGAR